MFMYLDLYIKKMISLPGPSKFICQTMFVDIALEKTSKIYSNNGTVFYINVTYEILNYTINVFLL